MTRKGFFATMAAVIGGGVKVADCVDRYAVVLVPPQYTLTDFVPRKYTLASCVDITTHSTAPWGVGSVSLFDQNARTK